MKKGFLKPDREDIITDEMKTINYKEFWSICFAMYKTVLPRTLILAGSLLAVALLINMLFS